MSKNINDDKSKTRFVFISYTFMVKLGPNNKTVEILDDLNGIDDYIFEQVELENYSDIEIVDDEEE